MDVYQAFLWTSKKPLTLSVDKHYFTKWLNLASLVIFTMYSNSFSHIKLSGHLSNRIQILKGTEQGHPLSPDLFKILISDLSPLLEINDCPKLSHMPISHLLWADDLIMLSLTPESSQQQINKLKQFCNDWGYRNKRN